MDISGYQNVDLCSDSIFALLGSKIHYGIINENATRLDVPGTCLQYQNYFVFIAISPCHFKSSGLLYNEQKFQNVCDGSMYSMST